MGSIERIGKGKYKLTVSQGFDASGKRIRRYKTVTASGKREAEYLLKEFEDHLHDASAQTVEEMRFGEFAEVWRENYASIKLEHSTMEIYEIMLTSILREFSKKRIAEVTAYEVTQFLNTELLNGRGSLEKKYNVLKSIFKYAKKWRVIQLDPMNDVEKPKNPHKEMDFYDLEELGMLINAIKELERRQQLKVELAVIGGLRRGEILAIADDAISWESNQIKVFRSVQFSKVGGTRIKHTKTGDSRIVTFPSWFMNKLRGHYLEILHIRSQHAYSWRGAVDTNGKNITLLFGDDRGEAMRPNSITQFWGKFMRRHPQMKRIRFHDLRHSSASLILSQGVNIKVLQKRLGHKRTSTTLNVYTHVTEKDDQQASDVFNDLSSDTLSDT